MRFSSNHAVVAESMIERAAELVGPAPRDRVHRGAHEVALTHIEGRDAHLNLLDRIKGDRGHPCSVSGRTAQAE
jgi:hypothetical protein